MKVAKSDTLTGGEHFFKQVQQHGYHWLNSIGPAFSLKFASFAWGEEKLLLKPWF